jgi:hypothetical protein
VGFFPPSFPFSFVDCPSEGGKKKGRKKERKKKENYY